MDFFEELNKIEDKIKEILEADGNSLGSLSLTKDREQGTGLLIVQILWAAGEKKFGLKHAFDEEGLLSMNYPLLTFSSEVLGSFKKHYESWKVKALEEKLMEDLISALEAQNEEDVEMLADAIFITKEGRANYENIRKFEKIANCRIYPVESDSFGWLRGAIGYQGTVYYFG